MIKGASLEITATVYQDSERTLPADLTSATVTFIVKKSAKDLDAAALFTKTVGSGIVLSDPANGVCKITITAADTNGLSFQTLYYETVAKLSSGTIIRSGVRELPLNDNLLKLLP